MVFLNVLYTSVNTWQSINKQSFEIGASKGLPMGNPGWDAANVGSKHFQGCGADAHARRLKWRNCTERSKLFKAIGFFQRGLSVLPGWLVLLMCGTSWACLPRRLPSPRTPSSMQTKRRKRKRRIQECFKDQRECTGLTMLKYPLKCHVINLDRMLLTLCFIPGSFIICSILRTKSCRVHLSRYLG